MGARRWWILEEPVADGAFEVKGFGVGGVGIGGVADRGGGINGVQGCGQRGGEFVGPLHCPGERLEICVVGRFGIGEPGIEMGKASEELGQVLAPNLAEDIGVG